MEARQTMKIALAIEKFDPRRGGAEQWTRQLAERLVELGHEVHVAAKSFSPDTKDLPITAHELGRVRSRLDFAAAAETVLRRIDPDVIHDMGGGWHCDVLQPHDGSRLAQWERKLASLPRWARGFKRGMIRVLPRYRHFRELMDKQFCDPRRIYIALSRMCSADFQKLHGVPPEQIRLVYNGVDSLRFSPENRAKHRHAIRRELAVASHEMLALFVGGDFRRKGLATAVRAIGRLARAGLPVRLAVVGGGKAGSYLKLSRKCAAAGAVAFLGSKSELEPYYAAADALVLPTFYDPCSLSVLEAAASGLPCVTTRFNGAGELLTDGVDGFVLPDAADDAMLSDRLGLLLDSGLRESMGDAARQMALQHTLDDNCRRIVEIYEEIVEMKSNNGCQSKQYVTQAL
jgi:UDP-glucose:(heptosyl)LPS alpha-1,3-glucosyltransferase